MTVEEMVAEHLKSHGLNGLRSDDGECRCHLSDLMTCDDFCEYRHCAGVRLPEPDDD